MSGRVVEVHVGLKLDVKVDHRCGAGEMRCLNCHSHFEAARSSVTEAVAARHFLKDLKRCGLGAEVMQEVLDCAETGFYELHKFEVDIEGDLVFRAKKAGVHLVYAIDTRKRLVFLRAFRNYREYTKFLEGKRAIKALIAQA